MAEQTAKERIAQLEAENAALRAAAGSPLHPDVQPAYFNGSVVIYQGEHHRVVGRSIDADGRVTYTLAPATFEMGPVDLRDPHGPQQAVNIRHDDEARVFDVAEAELGPLDDSHLSRGAKPQATASGKSDAAAASESVAIEKD